MSFIRVHFGYLDAYIFGLRNENPMRHFWKVVGHAAWEVQNTVVVVVERGDFYRSETFALHGQVLVQLLHRGTHRPNVPMCIRPAGQSAVCPSCMGEKP